MLPFLFLDSYKFEGALIHNPRYPVSGWYGAILIPPAEQPYDAYLMLMPKELGNPGVVPMKDEVCTEAVFLRDSGVYFKVYGELTFGGPDAGGCQMPVNRIEIEGNTTPTPLTEPKSR